MELWLSMNVLVHDHHVWTRRRAEQRLGMPFSRFRALRRLETGDRTQRELAEMMHVDAAAISGIVSDLQRRGLVERTASPDDARCKIVAITDAGRAIMADYRGADELAPPIFDALNAEQRAQLAALLEAMKKAAR